MKTIQANSEEEFTFAVALSPYHFIQSIPDLLRKYFLAVCHAWALPPSTASENLLKSKLIPLMLSLVKGSAFRQDSDLMKARPNVSLGQICGWILKGKRISCDPWEKKDDYNVYGMLLEISPDHRFMVDSLSLQHAGSTTSTIAWQGPSGRLRSTIQSAEKVW